MSTADQPEEGTPMEDFDAIIAGIGDDADISALTEAADQIAALQARIKFYEAQASTARKLYRTLRDGQLQSPDQAAVALKNMSKAMKAIHPSTEVF